MKIPKIEVTNTKKVEFTDLITYFLLAFVIIAVLFSAIVNLVKYPPQRLECSMCPNCEATLQSRWSLPSIAKRQTIYELKEQLANESEVNI